MKAVLIKSFGDANQLYIGNINVPVIKANEVLIKVHASAMNRADILQRKGFYPPPIGESEVFGLEAAGEIAALGAEVNNWKIGDKVFTLLTGGGQAQYVSARADALMPIPDNLDFIEAGAIAEVFLTAWDALVLQGKIEIKQKVLIHAGASGVGSAAIQIAKLFEASIASTASAGKIDFIKSLGVDLPVSYDIENFVEKIRNAYSNVDLIVDTIGADYFNDNLDLLALEGKMILLGLMSGRVADQVNLGKILIKKLHIIGSTLRNRPPDYKAKLIHHFSKNALPKFASGELKPIVDCVMDLNMIQEAHNYMENNQNKGKIVIRIPH